MWEAWLQFGKYITLDWLSGLKSLYGNTEQEDLVRGVCQTCNHFCPPFLWMRYLKKEEFYIMEKFALFLMINKKKKENSVIGVADA